MTQNERGKRNAQMIRLYNDGLSCEDIGKIYCMSKQNVQKTLIQYGVERRPEGRYKKDYDIEKYKDKIIELRNEGIAPYAVMSKLGFTYSKSTKPMFNYIKSIPEYGNENLRKCPVCGIIADKEMFYDKNPNHKISRCRKCYNDYQKEYKEKHPEKREHRLELMREWEKKNRKGGNSCCGI